MNQPLNFLKYNNAVPLVMFAIFGMATASFAASEEVRDAVYATAQEIRQVDNTYLVSANIADRDFKMQVTGVKEDDQMFYVAYSYNDISVVEYVWKEVTVNGTLTVSKKELEGGDLGLFVAKQLGEVVRAKRDYLVAVQEHERKSGVTTKVVATTYSGIVGKFLDPEEQVFPGYIAVIEPVVKESAISAPIVTQPEDVQGGTVSVSLPATAQQTGLTEAQIEALVAEQVRKILASSSPSSPASAPPASESPIQTSSTTLAATSTGETSTPTDTSTSTVSEDVAPPEETSAPAATSTSTTSEDTTLSEEAAGEPAMEESVDPSSDSASN